MLQALSPLCLAIDASDPDSVGRRDGNLVVEWMISVNFHHPKKEKNLVLIYTMSKE
jgi:hypothetical protein